MFFFSFFPVFFYVIQISWELNGRDIINDNVLTEDETIGNKLWRNITILNITNYDAGIYVCAARNHIGSASRNISIYLTEIVQHVIEKGPETFWYFGLILGTFGTVFCLITISFLVCLCKKTTRRRRSIKNIKGSVSFNDQEKKLLDLSITTNDRQDSGEVANTPSVAKNEPVIALEPVQITIENLSRNDEFPMNVGVFTPPPEFCSNANPAYGNIFISVALTQDVIDNPEQMYPDLLNIPNRVIGKLFPINVSNYATLPRNRHQRTGSLGSGSTSASSCSASTTGRTQTTSTVDGSSSSKNTRLQNVINYQNLDTTTHLSDTGSIGLCTGCLKKQDSSKAMLYPIKYDNMGRRITASGNSILSTLPDEEKESAIDSVNISSDMCTVSASCANVVDGASAAAAAAAAANACTGTAAGTSSASTSRAAIISGSVGLNVGCSSSKTFGATNLNANSINLKSNSKLSDRDSKVADDKMRDAQGTLLLPSGCDYVSL